MSAAYWTPRSRDKYGRSCHYLHTSDGRVKAVVVKLPAACADRYLVNVWATTPGTVTYHPTLAAAKRAAVAA